MLGLTVAFAAGYGMASQASAQVGDVAGFAEMNIHDYLHRDITLFAQALNMDEGQRVIVESLYEDYRTAFDRGWAETQRRFSDMREDLQNVDRDRVMAIVLAPFEDWQAQKERIREQFEENVKVILNRDQLAQWPAFQRQMTREKTLHRGRLSGESLDLFHVLRDIRLDERTQMSIEPVMDQYGLALHEALLQRNQTLRKAQAEMLNSIRNQNMTTDFNRVDEEIRRRTAIRDVNDQYIEYIASVLPGDFGDEFRTSALERAYPRVFRPLPAQRLFAEAKRIEGLDADMIDQVEQLESSMVSEVNDINVKLHRGVREHEPKAMRNQAEIIAARQAGDNAERLVDPNIADYRTRDDRVNYYVTQLRELLGTEQFAALPGASRYVPDRRTQQVPDPTVERRRQEVIQQGREREAREVRESAETPATNPPGRFRP